MFCTDILMHCELIRASINYQFLCHKQLNKCQQTRRILEFALPFAACGPGHHICPGLLTYHASAGYIEWFGDVLMNL